MGNQSNKDTDISAFSQLVFDFFANLYYNIIGIKCGHCALYRKQGERLC